MSDNYSVTPNSINEFLEATAAVVSTTSNHVRDIQKIINGYSADTVIDSIPPMSATALRNELDRLQLQVNVILDTIQRIKNFCNMVQDILAKEGLLSSDWQKTAQPAIDEFKNLEGIL